MKISSLWCLGLPLLAAAAKKDIVVDQAPDSPRPYVLPRFRGRQVLLTSTQVITYSITEASSGGAFALLQHNGKVSGWLNGRPHAHYGTHEHFICTRGRSQLWARRPELEATQEARVFTPGDYGNAPPGTIHIFQLVDPDTQLTHAFSPAGFEKMFFNISVADYESAVGAPFIPDHIDEPRFGPNTPEQNAELAKLDVNVQPPEVFTPRRDMVNGTAGNPDIPWHNGNNTIPDDPYEPYFIAKDYGPKYLNTQVGYKVIQPLAAPEKNFTMGTITMSAKLKNERASKATLPHPFGLQLTDGQLLLTVKGYKPTYLLQGDVAFIPAGIPFTYEATVPFTKFIYLNGGSRGLDHQLLRKSIPWGFATYPVHAGFRA